MLRALLCLHFVVGGALAGEPESGAPVERSTRLFSSAPAVRLPTLGGMQFWADVRWHAGYRVQRNDLLRVCRLLDEKNQLVLLAGREECLARLQEVTGDRPACPQGAEVVILLHGLMGFRHAMSGLGDHLQQEGGYTIVNLSYPSTQANVADHAASLAEVIDHLRAARCGKIHFVAHSLGNLVVRRYFFARAEAGAKDDAQLFGRMVMLGPPNQGARMAETKVVDVALQVVGGAPARQLAWEWEKLQKELVVPPLEFGIVAGGLGNELGFNPLLPGDDDGAVAVAETRLPGAADFATVPVNHSGLMLHARTREYVLRFLREGRFREGEPREPIEATAIR